MKKKGKDMAESKTKRNLKEKQKRKINPWKISFLVLAGLLLGALLFFTVRVFENREVSYTPSSDTLTQSGEATFQVQLKKAQVNQVIDYYLNDFQKGSSVKYKFYLENVALLNGTFQVLGHDVEFYLYFDPYVTEEGNVLLKAKSLSIGTLSLPISDILKYVVKNYKLPKWVEPDTENNSILINLNKFEMANGMHILANKINLVDDDIRLDVYLPATAGSSSDSTQSTTSTSEK